MEGMERKHIHTSIYSSSVPYVDVLTSNEYYLALLLLSNNIHTRVCGGERKHSMPQLMHENFMPLITCLHMKLFRNKVAQVRCFSGLTFPTSHSFELESDNQRGTRNPALLPTRSC